MVTRLKSQTTKGNKYLHHQLMRPRHERKAVIVIEIFRYILTKSVPDAPRALQRHIETTFIANQINVLQ